MNQPTEQDQQVMAMLEQSVADNPVILFMKGNPEQPQCGFSARAVQALIDIGKPFSYVDIYQEPEVRRLLPAVSEWPTFPQLFIAGELVGGSDIVADLASNGELRTMVDQAVDSAEPGESADSADSSTE